jgi:outer membrane protein, protease secretion system
MRRRRSGLAAALAVALASMVALGTPARAAGVLADAFGRAQAHDPTYRAARHEHDAVAYNVTIARAGLLPSVTLSTTLTSTRGWRDSPGLFGNTVRQELDYRSPVMQLVVRAPLLNLDALMRYRQSGLQVTQAVDVLRIRRLELAARLGAALFDRLLAQEQLTLTQALVDAAAEQRRLAERRLAGGEATRIDVSDADAALAVARAQLVDARLQAAVAQRALGNITGEDGLSLAVPAVPSPTPPMAVATLGGWIDQATLASPSVQARRVQLDYAVLDVERARVGHAPRIDIVATSVESRNESLSTLNQEARLGTLGIQISLPIFNGWAVTAATDQARVLQGRAAAELDGELATVRLEVERQYSAVESGSERIAALQMAEQASVLSLEGTQRALLAGLRSTADVLAAQRQLFNVRRDLAQSRLDYLLARLQLQAAAGLDADEIVADLDRFLVAVR